jgi:hypothetical protein
MSEFDQSDMDRVLSEMEKAASAMNGMARGSQSRGRGSRQEAAEALESALSKVTRRAKSFDDSLANAINNSDRMNESFEGAVDQLTRFTLSGFAGAAALGALITKAMSVTKVYQQMSEVGQSFGGSMAKMMIAAGEAGLPLNEFAAIQSKHNATINATNGNYFKMNSMLRDQLKTSGLYGMTIEQLADFSAGYLEVSRLNGTLATKSNAKVVKEMGELALTTTGLAEASDKTRQEITQLATAALSSASAIAGISVVSANLRDTVDKNAKTTTAIFASLNGEAGEFFSKFFADSIGMPAAMTQQASTLIDSGMSPFVSRMQEISRKNAMGLDTTEDAINASNDFKEAVEANMPVLRAQAAAGNESAAQTIRMAAAIQKRTKAEIDQAKDAAKNKPKWTAFWLSIDSIYKGLVGAFNSSFIKGFTSTMTDLGKFGESNAGQRLKNFLESLGEQLGKFLGGVLTSENIERFANGIFNLAKCVFEAVESFTMNGGFVSLQNSLTMLGGFISVVTYPLRLLGDVLSSMSPGFVKAAGMIGGVGFLLFKAWKMVTGMLGMRAQTMNVRAGTVNIDGGGGGGGDGGGRGRGRGRGGRLGRAARGARARFGRSSLGRMARGVGGVGRVAGLGRLALGGVGALAGMGGEMIADNMQDGAAKTAIGSASRAAGYAATGAMLGSFLPGAGTLIGGALGGAYGLYSGYKDYSAQAAAAKPQMPAMAVPKPSAIPGMAAMAVPATAAAASAAKPTVDPAQVMIDELKKQTEALSRMAATLGGKIDQGNTLLRKIEVSAQSL